MKYIYFLVFVLITSCANQPKRVPHTFIEGLDDKEVLQVNDKIVLGTKIDRVIWTLTKVDTNSAVFHDEEVDTNSAVFHDEDGDMKVIFSTGFLPGSYTTGFQVQKHGVLFYPDEFNGEL